MPKFIQLKSPTGNHTYWVNADNVTYLQENTRGCTINFDAEQSISVGETAADVVRRFSEAEAGPSVSKSIA
jgi:hypothetical protein